MAMVSDTVGWAVAEEGIVVALSAGRYAHMHMHGAAQLSMIWLAISHDMHMHAQNLCGHAESSTSLRLVHVQHARCDARDCTPAPRRAETFAS